MSTVKHYRKVPVVIQALEFTYSHEGLEALKAFCGKELISYGKDRCMDAIGWAHIGTLEDGDGVCKHVATEGDYIIKGVHGEFYPCKPDIFHKTYEMVDPEYFVIGTGEILG